MSAGVERPFAPLALRLANLALLVLLPIAWAAPLVHTSLLPAGWTAPLVLSGLLPFLDSAAISILGAIATLWPEDPLLSVVVAAFGVALPFAKTAALALIHHGCLTTRALPVLETLGRLAMADVFLIALAIVIAKGVGIGRMETAWGLPLFTGCVLASLAVSMLTARALRAAP